MSSTRVQSSLAEQPAFQASTARAPTRMTGPGRATGPGPVTGVQDAALAEQDGPRSSGWLSVPERGTLWGIMAVFWLATAFGRAPVRLLVRVIALYYALFDRKVIEASRQWWTMVTGKRPKWSTIYGHIRRFSNVTLDRMFLIRGRTTSFSFTRDGVENLNALTRTKKGAILLGAHLGSFEAMRLAGNEEQHAINIVGNFSNAKMINALLDGLSSDNTARLIHAEPGDVGFVFAIQERIQAGELVAILGDRVAKHQPYIEVEFFGRPAKFPKGPFQLAALLKCPIYLVFGVFSEPDRYALSCKPFAEQIVLPRRNREAALKEYVQAYARRLEDQARAAPDNWFNFYDFWA